MPNTTQPVDLEQFPRLRTIDYLSPFRYPGGKAFLTGFLSSIAQSVPDSGEVHYVEPFCGGAGAALGLLSQNAVQHIHLNDADPRVYSAWHAIIYENDRFLSELSRRPVSIETWHECRAIISDNPTGYSFDVGFATFFINRTSRAGIIIGSGPIGGYEQRGEWKIGARFYPETIRKRLDWIGKNSEKITLSNVDGLDFLKKKAQELSSCSTLYFVDPPYVKAGGRLYLDAMTEQKHRDLSNFLKTDACKNWVLTYDDHPLVRELYEGREISSLNVNYSLRKTRKELELLVR